MKNFICTLPYITKIKMCNEELHYLFYIPISINTKSRHMRCARHGACMWVVENAYKDLVRKRKRLF